MVGLRFQPGVTWVNTKQRRITANNDAPIFQLNHTVGLYNFGRADYPYNFTEATIYKRFWLHSWGKMDVTAKGGVQWNKVPFPLLIMPAANLSYIMEDNTFSLINNMEFLNDRYASLMWSWDLNGKIFNRIPLLKSSSGASISAATCCGARSRRRTIPRRTPGRPMPGCSTSPVAGRPAALSTSREP